jgi:hypothetical protein
MARPGYYRDSAFPHGFGEVRQIKSRRAVLRAEGKNVRVVSMHSAPRTKTHVSGAVRGFTVDNVVAKAKALG